MWATQVLPEQRSFTIHKGTEKIFTHDTHFTIHKGTEKIFTHDTHFTIHKGTEKIFTHDTYCCCCSHAYNVHIYHAK
jgi:hypothetical protein